MKKDIQTNKSNVIHLTQLNEISKQIAMVFNKQITIILRNQSSLF